MSSNKESYASTGGFHSLWKRISVDKDKLKRFKEDKKLNYKDSFYYLSYIFMHENGEEKNLLKSEVIEDYKVKNTSRDGSYSESFLNKGHSNNKIVLIPKFRQFLINLANFLYTNGEINYQNFNIIRDNVRQAYIKRFNLNDLSEDNDVFTYAFSDGEDEYTQAELPKDISESINKIRKKDTFGALTWLLIFSLYPNNEEGQNLIKDIANELLLSNGKASYKVVLDKLSAETGKSKGDIEFAFQMYLENDLIGHDILKPAQYLSLLNAKNKEIFEANKNNYKELNKINDRYEKAYDIIEFQKSDDTTFCEGIKSMLIKSDALWKMSCYDDMRQILNEAESLLYDRPDFSDNNMELYASVKRRQGICINHYLLFDEALQIYKSSYFFFRPYEKYDRSKINNNEGYIYRKWCKFDKSCMSYKKAYELRKHMMNTNPFSVSLVLSNSSVPLMLSHKYDEAKKCVKEAYNIRVQLYRDLNDTKVKWPLVFTTIYYSLLYFLQGLYGYTKAYGGYNQNNSLEKHKTNDNRIDFDIFLEKALEKLKEVEGIIGTEPEDNISNVKELLYFYIQYGITCMYYKKRRPLSQGLFGKALELYSRHKDDLQEETAIIIAMALFYRSKLGLINGKDLIEEVMPDVIKGYSMLDKLYDECIDKSYLRYANMIRSFHLGAYLLLLNDREFDAFKELCKSDKVSSMFTKEGRKKFLKLCDSKKKALELVKKSYNEIEELMKKNTDFDIYEYKYNEEAFKTEKAYIYSFIEEFEDLPEKNLSGEKKKKLIETLEYFFIIYLW